MHSKQKHLIFQHGFFHTRKKGKLAIDILSIFEMYLLQHFVLDSIFTLCSHSVRIYRLISDSEGEKDILGQ